MEMIISWVAMKTEGYKIDKQIKNTKRYAREMFRMETEICWAAMKTEVYKLSKQMKEEKVD